MSALGTPGTPWQVHHLEMQAEPPGGGGASSPCTLGPEHAGKPGSLTADPDQPSLLSEPQFPPPWGGDQSKQNKRAVTAKSRCLSGLPQTVTH